MQQTQQTKPVEQESIQKKDQVELKQKISPQLVKKYKEIFDSYDKEQDGYVQAKDVPGVMKILGVTISEQQVIQMLGDRVQKSDNPLVSSKIEFQDFLSLIIDKQNEITMKQELMESFRVFDPEKNGFMPTSEFRYYLRTYGIAMPQDQVQQLIKQSQPEQGYVKYEKFIDKLLGLNQG